ncbi:MAG: hypothetical protein ACREP1_11520, partial [Rhodanobacteraceae bacterium]
MGFAARAVLFCGLALPLLGAKPAQPSPLETLLARMRATSGLPAGAHIVSTVHYVAGENTLVRRIDSEGLREYSERCNGAICFGTYFDGERLFSVNMNGTALPDESRPEFDLRGVRTVLSGAFLAPSFQRDGNHIEDHGVSTVAGKRYHRIDVAARDAIPMEVYVDPQTALVAMTRDADEVVRFEPRDYRRVGSYLLPFAIERNGEPFETFETRSVLRSAFEPPTGLAPAFDASPPMALDPASAAPIGPCTSAGISARCLIDTGNSGIAMSLELAEQLRAPVVGAFRVSGLGAYATEV